MHVMNAHMMHALMHKNLFNFSTFTNNWLAPRVLTKNPNFLKFYFSKPNQIDQLIITVVRKYHIMTLWGQKVLEASAYSISNLRPTPRRKKCLGTKWRESKLPERTAEDNPVLSRPKSWEKKLPHRPRTSTRGSPKRFQAIWANHRGIGGEAAPGKAVTSVLNMHN